MVMELMLHFWVEVSGSIERYFRKHNGYPMPNTLTSKILKIDESKITLSQNDEVHYTRQIDGDIYEKIIFGVKDNETFEKVLAEVENYGSFMRVVNNIDESVSNRYTVKQAIYIIENIYRAHEEDEFNELIPSWHQGLMDCLETLCNVSNKSQYVIDYIKYGKYLIEDMQVLELHPLELNNSKNNTI